jgi:nitrate reductase NapD
MIDDFNVCSLVVHLAPARAEVAERAIAALPGVEIHGRADKCRLIVTAVDGPQTKAVDQITAIHRAPGVVSAALVFHAFDSAADADTPADDSQQQRT